tara:strand:- start:9468 stop:9929 length:462 start_codon:yes stop_codon:yes gene_type:complete
MTKQDKDQLIIKLYAFVATFNERQDELNKKQSHLLGQLSAIMQMVSCCSTARLGRVGWQTDYETEGSFQAYYAITVYLVIHELKWSVSEDAIKQNKLDVDGYQAAITTLTTLGDRRGAHTAGYQFTYALGTMVRGIIAGMQSNPLYIASLRTQ